MAVLLAGGLGVACAAPRSPEEARIERARLLAAEECREGSAAERASWLASLRGVEQAGELVEVTRGKHDKTRIVGARITVLAVENIAPAHLQRQIECHESDVVLGKVSLEPSDPFALGSEWVVARVRSAEDRLVVELQPVTPDGVRATVERARQYAQYRR